MGPTGAGLAAINNSPANVALVSPWNSYNPARTAIATSYQQGAGYDLFVFNTTGTIRTRLTNLSAAAIIGPHFTTDGLKIVFEAILNGSGSIFSVNPDGTGLTNLTVSNGPDALLDLH